jgi:acyl-CoA synthetase (AMP-forming)/AMP-acid ligase II
MPEEHVDRTIPAAVASAAREFGDAPALAEPGGPHLGYRQLHERVSGTARALIAAGVRPADRVAIWSPNTHHWVLGALGALYAGATLVPVSTRFTGPEALDVISRSGACTLIVAGQFLGTDRLAALRQAEPPRNGTAAGQCLDNLSVVIRVPVEPAAPASDATAPVPAAGPQADPAPPTPGPHPAPRPQADPAPPTPGPHPDPRAAANSETAGGWAGQVIDWAELDDLAATVPAELADERAAGVTADDVSDILFTSGTTGRSKGAMSAHRQSLAVASAWAECGCLGPGDRYLVVNPFFHSFGLKAGLLACLVSGAALVPQPVFDAGQAMRLVETERITVLPGAPTIYQAILDHPGRADRDLSSLRLAVTGAATVPVALVERMRRELTFDTVLTAYGLTEAVVATMCRPGDDPQTVASTSGRAAAGFEVRIAGDPGQAAGVNDGHRANLPSQADERDEGATAAPGMPGEILLRGPNLMLGYLDDQPATDAAVDADGWLHTGDVGFLDERGYLTITDRLKDMYICGGFNVYPAEVEQVLARLDGVAESAVVGVPDPRLGEVGQAYLVMRTGHALDTAAVLAFCRDRLANYKVPRHVEFRASLPRNPAGKILKRLLREESA